MSELDTIEIAKLTLGLEHAKARAEHYLRLIAQLVKDREREGGFMWPESQDTIREAKAVLAENGR